MLHRDVTALIEFDFQFSICTLVTNFAEYEEMKESFLDHGMNDCEFLVVDNSQKNQLNAYQGIRKFFNTAKGKYIIFCHQDIVVKATLAQLKVCLQELNEKHPNWAIAGNAGGKHIKGKAIHLINHDGKIATYDSLPVRVYNLDENFILVDAAKFSAVSANLEGFHFYGTDLCLLADIQGYESYVIDFLVHHKSGGKIDACFYTQKEKFKEKYASVLRQRFMETTTTRLFISGNRIKNYAFNNVFIFFWVKIYHKYLKNLRKT